MSVRFEGRSRERDVTHVCPVCTLVGGRAVRLLIACGKVGVATSCELLVVTAVVGGVGLLHRGGPVSHNVAYTVWSGRTLSL